MKTVYPCVYREHAVEVSKLSPVAGLSLCIQGTLYSYPEFEEIFRFIPVYTGNIMIHNV